MAGEAVRPSGRRLAILGLNVGQKSGRGGPKWGSKPSESPDMGGEEAVLPGAYGAPPSEITKHSNFRRP